MPVTLNGTNGLTFNDGSSQVTAAYNALSNLIINGCARVAQRGNVAAVASTWVYGGCDRTAVNPSGFTTVSSGTIQQSGNAGTATGYAQSLLNLTTTGSGTVNFGQKIESINTRQLAGKNLTIGAKIYQDTGAALTADISVYKANSTDNFSSITQVGSTVSVGSIPSATYTAVTATIPIGASDASTGLWVVVRFNGVGAVTTKNFAIGDFSAEAGSVVSNFVVRPYGMELALCQRYYYQYSGDFRLPLVRNDTPVRQNTFNTKVTMRTAPTVANITASGTTTLLASDVDSVCLTSSAGTLTSSISVSAFTASSEL